ncbi:hypothetical protein [Streptomyces brasiliensis]|nr:hypothetical protein [Streptomyces brasiliensis]
MSLPETSSAQAAAGIEIPALRHRLLVRQRQVGKPAFTDTDRWHRKLLKR